MLDQEKQTILIQLIEDYVYKSLDTELKSLTESVTESVQEDYDYGLSLDTLKRHIKEGLHKDLLEANPGVDEWSDEFLSDCVVVDGIVDTLFEDIEEACDCDDGDKDDDDKDDKDDKDDADDDKDDKDDKDDDKDDDKEPTDEAALTKHHITKIQSVIDARKRATDPQYKLSRKHTLMKQAARGGRIIDRKLSKALKKSYRAGFGKRWEGCDRATLRDGIKKAFDNEGCDNDGLEGPNVNPKEKTVKKIKEIAKIRKEAVAESVKEMLSEIPSFETLEEAETEKLTESFSNLLLDKINSSVDNVTDDILEELDNFINEEVIPDYTQKTESYIMDEVFPAMQADVSDYLDYVIEAKLDEIMESGKIYKSAKSIQLEDFTEKLLDLIKEDLQIYPEQEDAVISLEKKVSVLEQSLYDAKVQKVKAVHSMKDLQDELWMEKNIPNGLSEAAKETLQKSLNELSTHTDTHELFEEQAKDIVDTYIKSHGRIVENVQPQPKQKPETDIVQRTLVFMTKR